MTDTDNDDDERDPLSEEEIDPENKEEAQAEVLQELRDREVL
jgi:hypothetical protein